MRFSKTFDELAVGALLRGDHNQLARLNKAARVHCGDLCPDCEATEVEDNGYGGYRCVACDHRWGDD